jgi:hypothetical protein
MHDISMPPANGKFFSCADCTGFNEDYIDPRCQWTDKKINPNDKPCEDFDKED